MTKKLLVLLFLPIMIIAQAPCNNFWQYVNNAGENEGILTLTLDNRYNEHNLQVILTVGSTLSSKYVGGVNLLKNPDNALNDVINGLSIQYRVRFPVQNPLPKLTEVRYNNRVMCVGDKDVGEYLTTITLNNTLVSRSPASNQIQSNQPVSQNLPAIQNQQVVQNPQVTPAISTNNRFSSQDNQCGVPFRQVQDFTSLVVNGIPAFKGQFPWLAAMFHNGINENGFICGGSLVSSKAIVTAAHCLHNKNDNLKTAEEVLFYIGKFLINSFTNEKDFIVAPASRLVLHPDWNTQSSSYDGDIAVALLSRVIQFTQFIRPICLWTYSNNYQDIINQQGVVAGYGKTHLSTAISDKPYWTALPVVDEATCLRSKAEFSKITSKRTFCVGSRDGKGPCNGDSGGALAVNFNGKWYLRGIVSASLFDKELFTCDTNNYAVFTDVAAFKDWIQQYI